MDKENVMEKKDIAQIERFLKTAGKPVYMITYDFYSKHETYHDRYEPFLDFLCNQMGAMRTSDSSYLIEHEGSAVDVFDEIRNSFDSCDSCFVIRVFLDDYDIY